MQLLLPNLIFLYVFFLYNLGEITSGILWADLFLPFFLIYILLAKKKYYLYKYILILLIYTIFLGSTSIYLGNNSLFYAFALTLRTTSFLLLIIVGVFLAEKHKSDDYLKNAIYIGITSALIITIINTLSGSKAYYGYAQILSTNAPAISGFMLGLASVFLLSNAKMNNKDFFFGSAAFIIAFLTLSISSLMSMLSAIIFYYISKLTLKRKKSFYKKILYSLVIIATFLFYLKTEISDNLYRVTHIFDKLDYRLDKVSHLSDVLCDSITCLLFGAGPGAHSYHNGINLGEGAILSFDQLYMRILVEWGVIGGILWLIVFLSLFYWIRNNKGKTIINTSLIALLIFGLGFGIGSEFIFISYSGSLWALLLGYSSERFRLTLIQKKHLA